MLMLISACIFSPLFTFTLKNTTLRTCYVSAYKKIKNYPLCYCHFYKLLSSLSDF